MRTVILDIEVLAGIAASVGIHDGEALTAHLGMELEPVTPLLLATILVRLPVTLAAVCALSDAAECEKIGA